MDDESRATAEQTQTNAGSPATGPTSRPASSSSKRDEDASAPVHRRKKSISSLVSSLFSVPPQKKLPGMTGGIYAVDGVDLDDEGRVMGMDPKYWIKDIDTGNVYSLEGDTRNPEGGDSTPGQAAGSGLPAGSSSPSKRPAAASVSRPMGPMEMGLAGTARSSREGSSASADAGVARNRDGNIRVSDVFSSNRTSRNLNEFEEALGYRPSADALGSLSSPGTSGSHRPQSLEDRAVANSVLVRSGAKWWYTAVNAVKRELNIRHAHSHPRSLYHASSMDANSSHANYASYANEPGLCTSPSASSPGSDGFGGPGLPGRSQYGLRVKVVTSRKNFKEFSGLRLVQSVYAHEGVVWVAKFSPNGKFLATAGQDGTVVVWKVNTNRSMASGERPAAGEDRDRGEGSRKANSNKDERKNKRSSDGAESVGPVDDADEKRNRKNGKSDGDDSGDEGVERPSVNYGSAPVLDSTPYRVYKGHKKDVLDLSWSSSNFLFSASMDKTVRLWHVSVDECLKIFRHNDFVTSIAVHPLDETLLLSGSIDGKVRLWGVTDARVKSWVDIHDMVTAVSFNADGSKAVVGSMRGKCRFYSLGPNNSLEYEAQLDVKNKHGHNSRGRKITGLTYAPNKLFPNALLCTSNDSRIRLYDGYTLRFKYKGLSNKSTQIKASFSSKGNFVISGSDDGAVFIWDCSKSPLNPSADTALMSRGNLVERTIGSISDAAPFFTREKNASWESFQASDDVVTCAIFAPDCARLKDAPQEYAQYAAFGQVILVAGTEGELKLYENTGGPQWL